MLSKTVSGASLILALVAIGCGAPQQSPQAGQRGKAELFGDPGRIGIDWRRAGNETIEVTITNNTNSAFWVPATCGAFWQDVLNEIHYEAPSCADRSLEIVAAHSTVTFNWKLAPPSDGAFIWELVVPTYGGANGRDQLIPLKMALGDNVILERWQNGNEYEIEEMKFFAVSLEAPAGKRWGSNCEAYTAFDGMDEQGRWVFYPTQPLDSGATLELRFCLGSVDDPDPCRDPLAEAFSVKVNVSDTRTADQADPCFRACGGIHCVDDPQSMPCVTFDWPQRYACYALAECVRLEDGQCGWETDEAFDECVAAAQGSN